MIRRCLSIALLLIFTPLFAANPEPAWIAKGFQKPESALYVKSLDEIFVSNVNGAPDEKNGEGFISRLDAKGNVIDLKWVTGLNAPKGMGYAQGKLFVADIDELVEIRVSTGKVVKRYKANGAKLLNDVTLEPRSHFKDQVVRAYVSDLEDNAIWYLADGMFSKSIFDETLDAPNGLLVEGETLLIATWGKSRGDPADLGRLKTMPLNSDVISDRFNAIPMGNLDGLESDGKGGYWLSDWVAGKIFHVSAAGKPEVWLDLEQGTADIGLIPNRILLVPMMLNNEVRAYPLP